MTSKAPNLDALRIDRSPPPPGSGRRWWVLACLLLIAGASAWWITRPKALQVTTATVQARDTARGGRTLLNASGYVTTRLEATVSSKITGKVTEILVEEGMQVAKDQVLARIDASNIETGLRLAEAQLSAAKLILSETEPLAKFADAELQRLLRLKTPGSVSASEQAKAYAEAAVMKAKLARLQADVTVAERHLDDWKQQVEDTVIRAPFAGVVTSKDSQPGEMISPMSAGGGYTRTGICTLVDMASLEIEVDVGESFINRVKAGQAVEATLDAYPEWKIPCKVTAIIPTADRQKATVRVRVAFAQLDPRILPQMGVKVAFQSDEPATGGTCLTIPKAAVSNNGGRDIVWVVKDGRVERRAVTVTVTGAGSDECTVQAGLVAGDTVAVNPPTGLTDGAAVESAPSR